jgi:hypothetical protein
LFILAIVLVFFVCVLCSSKVSANVSPLAEVA